MIIMLISSAAALVACAIIFKEVAIKASRKSGDTIGASVVCLIIAAILVLGPLTVSYNSYIKIRVFYDSVHEQYYDAITIYGDKATIDTERAFTDFKYQGYQENIAIFIRDLRSKVTEYNTKFLSKKVMKRNPFLNWYIVVPDPDMKPLSMLRVKGDG